MNSLIQLKQTSSVFLVAFALACFVLSSGVQAVSPPPDGGYPGGNTAEGQSALLSLTTGHHNTAVGYLSLRSDATGSYNTAIGAGALLANTTNENTATGFGALLSNTTGADNTANGVLTLFSNTGGNFNTAIGSHALFLNTFGGLNTAIGLNALFGNTVGSSNTATGFNALQFNSTGNGNTANGDAALNQNTTGLANTAVGEFALISNTTGNLNIALGSSAGINHVSGDNNLYLGNPGVDGESNTIRLGSGATGGGAHTSTFIAAVRGVTTVNNDAIPVLIDSAGQLGTMSSSRRFKTDIKPIDKASESILALKPVSFCYKVHKDTTPQFGLIAEDVAEVNRDLVICDADGKPYTVRYDAVNAMLLNEFLKEHRKNEQQEATIARLEKQIEALTAGLQKVSAQLELNKPAPQTVLNGQ